MEQSYRYILTVECILTITTNMYHIIDNNDLICKTLGISMIVIKRIHSNAVTY